MNECARIAMRHKVGTVGQLLGQRKPSQTRDHRRDNIKAVRSLSRQMQQQKLEAEKPADPGFRLRQFENIPSRLHQTPKRLQSTGSEFSSSGLNFGFTFSQVTPPRPKRSASTPEFSPCKTSPPGAKASPWARAPLRPCNPSSQQQGTPVPDLTASKRATRSSSPIRRIHEGQKSPSLAGSRPKRSKSAGTQRPSFLGDGHAVSPQKESSRFAFAPASRASKENVPPPRRQNVDGGPRQLFTERDNFSGATSSKASTSPGWWPGSSEIKIPKQASQNVLKAKERPSSSAGHKCVPPFAEHQDARAAVPDGYRILPEEDRLRTLSNLQDKMKELNNRYMRLPLKIETEGHRQQQKALREMIAETERAETLFSRPTVLVEV